MNSEEDNFQLSPSLDDVEVTKSGKSTYLPIGPVSHVDPGPML